MGLFLLRENPGSSPTPAKYVLYLPMNTVIAANVFMQSNESFYTCSYKWAIVCKCLSRHVCKICCWNCQGHSRSQSQSGQTCSCLLIIVTTGVFCTLLKIPVNDTSKNLNLTFQGHPRSKVMVSNERLYTCSYKWTIVWKCLSCLICEIFAAQILKVSWGQRSWCQIDSPHMLLSVDNSNHVYFALFAWYSLLKFAKHWFDLSRSTKVKGHGVKWKFLDMFLLAGNSNLVSILHPWWDICPQSLQNLSMTFQGHARSKVMVPNESAYTCFLITMKSPRGYLT